MELVFRGAPASGNTVLDKHITWTGLFFLSCLLPSTLMEATFVESPLVLWTSGLLGLGSMGLFSASTTVQPLRPQEQKVPCGSLCRISRTSPTALPTPRCTKPFHSSLHSAISLAPQDKLQLTGAVSFIFWPLCPSPFQPVFSALLGVAGGEPSPGGACRRAVWICLQSSPATWILARYSSSSQPTIPQR